MIRCLAALVVLLPCAALAATPEPAPAPTLALAAVTGRGGVSADDAASVADAITAQLVSDGRLRVVERDQVARVMKEQALSQSGAMSDEVQIQLGKLVGARWVAVGAVQARGAGYALSLRAIDTSTAHIAFADSLKVGNDDQLEAGGRQLAQRLEAKLTGAAAGELAGGPVGDFDPSQVRDAATALVRSLSMRFPKLDGKVVDSLPNGTLTCTLREGAFAGQRFEVDGRDEVTGQPVRKGFFLLTANDAHGCAGRVKSEPGQAVGPGDTLASLPIQVELQPLEAGAGTQPEVAKLLSDETRAALDGAPQFAVAAKPQLTILGRVSGARGRRSVQVQVVDEKGSVVQKLELPGSF